MSRQRTQEIGLPVDRTLNWTILESSGLPLGKVTSEEGRVVDATGEVALALLARSVGDVAGAGLAQVVVVVPGEPERALVELKRASLSLSPVEARQLLGLDKPGRRVFLYHRVRETLSAEGRAFWDAHEEAIRRGVWGGGREEVRLAEARGLVHRLLGGEVRRWERERSAEAEAALAARWGRRRVRWALRAALGPLGAQVAEEVAHGLAHGRLAETPALQWWWFGGPVTAGGLPAYLRDDRALGPADAARLTIRVEAGPTTGGRPWSQPRR